MERDETDGNVDQFPSLQTCFVRQNVICFFSTEPLSLHGVLDTYSLESIGFAPLEEGFSRGFLLCSLAKKVRPSLLFLLLLFSLAEKWKRRMLKKNIQNANSHRRPKKTSSPPPLACRRKRREKERRERVARFFEQDF